MSKQRFATILGLLFLLAGILGFVPPLIWPGPGRRAGDGQPARAVVRRLPGQRGP